MVAQTPDAYQYGIIRSGHKLIYDERLRQHLLFDLRSDPGEERDLTAAALLSVWGVCVFYRLAARSDSASQVYVAALGSGVMDSTA